jgi:hypothetical protein
LFQPNLQFKQSTISEDKSNGKNQGSDTGSPFYDRESNTPNPDPKKLAKKSSHGLTATDSIWNFDQNNAKKTIQENDDSDSRPQKSNRQKPFAVDSWPVTNPNPNPNNQDLSKSPSGLPRGLGIGNNSPKKYVSTIIQSNKDRDSNDSEGSWDFGR